MMSEPLEACPACGGAVSSWPTCHTWPQARGDGSEMWMACQGCDSARDWYCVEGEDGCGWDWTDGLNPRNPRAAANAEWSPAAVSARAVSDAPTIDTPADLRPESLS